MARDYAGYAARIQAEYGVSPRTRTRMHNFVDRDSDGNKLVSDAEVDLLLRDNADNSDVTNDLLRQAIGGLADVRDLAQAERDLNASRNKGKDKYTFAANAWYDWKDWAEDSDIALDASHHWGYHPGASVVDA